MKKNKKGFTLVELVIVVAVMAVLIAVAIPTVTSITKTAQRTVADTNARTIESTLKLKEANLSKDGDTIVELEPQHIIDALTEAKLGVSGTFAYNAETGVVRAIYDSKFANDDDVALDEDSEIEIELENGVVTKPVVEAPNPGGEGGEGNGN